MPECFTVNVIDRTNVVPISVTAAAFPARVEVPCPEHGRGNVAFEYRRDLGIQVGPAREIILGQIVRCDGALLGGSR